MNASAPLSWGTPPFRSGLAEDEIHVWAARLDAEPSRIERLVELLSPDERGRMDRFYFEAHRHRFAVGRGTLREILALYLNTEPGRIQFAYTARGKPELSGDHAWLQFNVAHSANVALFAITRLGPVGVDVESIRPITELEAIARRFFCAAEAHCLLALPESVRGEAFFNCWTRKEAFLKATGEGLIAPLDEFEVSLAPGERAILRSIRTSGARAEEWSLHDLRPVEGYVGALAIQRREVRLQCWSWPGTTI